MSASHGRLGDLLVAAGQVTEEQVQEALRRQRESGLRLGEQLVAMGAIGELQLVQALSRHLAVPWVALTRVDFTRELLDQIPAELAERYGLVPVFLQRRSRTERVLHVAMEDPTNEEALTAVRRAARTSVRAMVAPPSEIRHAIRVYYFGGEDRPALRPLQLEAGARPSPSALDEPSSRPVSERPTAGRPSPRATDSGEAPSVSSASTFRDDRVAPEGDEESGEAVPRVVTFTLLDGTVVRLPVGRRGGAVSEPEVASSEDALTARDLVAALDARMEGQDVSSVLPDARWEPLFAALLQVLLDKGLVADWEFVDAWKRHRRGG